MSLKYLFYLFIGIVSFSCTQTKKENSIVGKWEYERLEHFSGKEVDLQDSLLRVVHEKNKGLTFTFNSDNTFSVIQNSINNESKEISKGEYKLSDDKKHVWSKNSEGVEGSLEIIELTPTLLKAHIIASSEEYFVFKRII